MRPAVRYVTRFPTPPAIPEFEGLLDEYQLLTRALRQHTGSDETPTIGHLGESIGQCNTYAEIPAMLAKALADGLSLEGAGEALSIGAASLFLRSLTGNPMDVHLHTGVNLRRYLVQLDGLSLRNKLLALLMWHVERQRATRRTLVRLQQEELERAQNRELRSRFGTHEVRTRLAIARGFVELIAAASRQQVFDQASAGR